MKSIAGSRPSLSRLGHLYADFQCIASGLHSVFIVHRDANSVAHSLADMLEAQMTKLFGWRTPLHLLQKHCISSLVNLINIYLFQLQKKKKKKIPSHIFHLFSFPLFLSFKPSPSKFVSNFLYLFTFLLHYNIYIYIYIYWNFGFMMFLGE